MIMQNSLVIKDWLDANSVSGRWNKLRLPVWIAKAFINFCGKKLLKIFH